MVCRYVLDGNGEVVDFEFEELNPATKATTGVSREELVGRRFGDLFGRGLLARYLPFVRLMRRQNRPVVHEDAGNYVAQLDKYFTSTYIPLGQTRFIASTRDVTERVRTEQERARLQAELESERNLLEAVVAESPVALALWRATDLRLEMANPAYFALAPDKDMAGKTLPEIWPEAPELERDFRRVAATGEPFQVSDRLVYIRRAPDAPEEPRHFSYSVIRIDLPGQDEAGLLNIAIETT